MPVLAKGVRQGKNVANAPEQEQIPADQPERAVVFPCIGRRSVDCLSRARAWRFDWQIPLVCSSGSVPLLLPRFPHWHRLFQIEVLAPTATTLGRLRNSFLLRLRRR